MLTATKIAGFIGAGLAGAAYVPQIWHLVRVRCSAGVSRLAFWVWLLASMLVLTHAIAVRAEVFIVLGGVQSAATAIILAYATKYRSSYCVGHMPPDPPVVHGGMVDETVDLRSLAATGNEHATAGPLEAIREPSMSGGGRMA